MGLWERALLLSSEPLSWAWPGLREGGGARAHGPSPSEAHLAHSPTPQWPSWAAVIHHRLSQTHLGGSDDLFCTCSVKGFHFSSNCNFYLFQGDLLTQRPARPGFPLHPFVCEPLTSRLICHSPGGIRTNELCLNRLFPVHLAHFGVITQFLFASDPRHCGKYKKIMVKKAV